VGVLLFAAWFIMACRVELPARWALALCLILAPHPGEVLFTLTNIHWVLAPFWPCSPPACPDSRLVAASELALLFLLGMTGPFVLLFCRSWFTAGGRRAGTATRPG
jgi:hypothetical protein